ncbi:hypothetical protein J6590_043775 [Homalodisca vitripennis]|nr:hypothetical protein J6590_043775 [Homalodisca vitripennis]
MEKAYTHQLNLALTALQTVTIQLFAIRAVAKSVHTAASSHVNCSSDSCHTVVCDQSGGRKRAQLQLALTAHQTVAIQLFAIRAVAESVHTTASTRVNCSSDSCHTVVCD